MIKLHRMKTFKLVSKYKTTFDQENAINSIISNYNKGQKNQVLLGVTGSGKTFTTANIINRLQKPSLIISHNKTLAAQLYQEFREFFPENHVSYFVSYYDYYQPEAYIPKTDTYIEKDAAINELIDKLRLKTTNNLLIHKDTIVIASVSCIYNLGSPKQYLKYFLHLESGTKIERGHLISKLIELQYERSDYGFKRGTFRVRGSTLDIYPAHDDIGVRVKTDENNKGIISIINTITGEYIENNIKEYVLHPVKHYLTDPEKYKNVFDEIRSDLNARCLQLENKGKKLESFRLRQKINYDLEMISELGYVKGIENYSRYFDGRKKGQPPYTLIDYFKEPYNNDWLVFVDESHITFPQIRGMYSGDMSRKKTLIKYGFRLPSAIDNRPLTFEEFFRRIPGFIATSATPSEWELSQAYDSYSKTVGKNTKNNKNYFVEQLLRPTGIPDPDIEIRPTKIQVKDVIDEIKKRSEKKQRVLVTTLTKKTAEDLSAFLKEQGISVHYLHSDIKTLERTDILDDLRKGKYDTIVGVNLLREGLDLPEVTLVAILDADKEGFLRSKVSLIQTMGRAARHVEGKVILYADKITGSMEKAIEEVERRRNYQLKMNKKFKIKPKSIKKPIRDKIIEYPDDIGTDIYFLNKKGKQADIDIDSMTPSDKIRFIKYLRTEMRLAAQDLNFELAAEIRDKIIKIQK